MKHVGAARRAASVVAAVAFTFCAHVAKAANVNCTFACEYRDDGSYSENEYLGPCPDIILTSQADADAWGICGNISGNVIIPSNNLTNISLTNFESISWGSLIVGNSSEMTEIVAPILQSINGNLSLSNLPSLTSIDMPVLDYTQGLWLDSLPLLKSVNFPKGNATVALDVSGTMSIINTALDNLDSFTVYAEGLQTIQIKDNPNLNNIDFAILDNVGVIDIARNGPASGPGTSLDFGNLSEGGDISISDVGYINMSSLYSATGDLTFSFNSFDILSLPKLQSIDGSLYITDNAALRNVTLRMSFVGSWGSGSGDLVVTDNPYLYFLDMPELSDVSGYVNLTGPMTEVTVSPDGSMSTNFTLNSTHPDFNCTLFDKLHDDLLDYYSEIKEKPSSNNSYSCTAYGPGSTKDSAVHYHRPKKPLSQGAKVGMITAGVVVGMLLVAYAGRWYNTKHPHPQTNRAAARGEVVHLDDVTGGVTRAEEDDADHPPKYARVGMPGEVPPAYDDSLNSSTGREVSAQDSEPTPAPTTNDAVAPAPKKRGFWRSIWSGTNGWSGNNV